MSKGKEETPPRKPVVFSLIRGEGSGAGGDEPPPSDTAALINSLSNRLAFTVTRIESVSDEIHIYGIKPRNGADIKVTIDATLVINPRKVEEAVYRGSLIALDLESRSRWRQWAEVIGILAVPVWVPNESDETRKWVIKALGTKTTDLRDPRQRSSLVVQYKSDAIADKKALAAWRENTDIVVSMMRFSEFLIETQKLRDVTYKWIGQRLRSAGFAHRTLSCVDDSNERFQARLWTINYESLLADSDDGLEES